VTIVDDFAVLDSGLPEGVRCDAEGNLWTSAGEAGALGHAHVI
jgi:gluconolactonase